MTELQTYRHAIPLYTDVYPDLKTLLAASESQGSLFMTSFALLETNTMGPGNGIMIAASTLRLSATHSRMDRRAKVSDAARYSIFNALVSNLTDYPGQTDTLARAPIEAFNAVGVAWNALHAMGDNNKVEGDELLRHTMDLVLYTTVGVPELPTYLRGMLEIVELAQSRTDFLKTDMDTSSRDRTTKDGLRSMQVALLSRYQP